MSLIKLFLAFLKIGCIAFGGGYGMLSLLKDEFVGTILTEDQFLDFVAISESTPGPIAINMATFIGSSQQGILGSLVSTIAVVLPAFTIIFIIASLLKKFLEYKSVKCVIKCIRPVVVGLIIATAITLALNIFASIKNLESNPTFNFIPIVIFAIIVIIDLLFKHFKKKISPIILIALSGILGVCLSYIIL